MTRFTEQSFIINILKKYAVAWLTEKGWKELKTGMVLDYKKGTPHALEEAVEIQMIRESS